MRASVPFPLPAHPAFRQTSSRAHAGYLIEVAARKHRAVQRQPRLKTAGFLWNSLCYDAGEGNDELDRRRNDLLWRTAGPRPRRRNSSATTQPGIQVGTNLFPWSGFMRTQQLINARSQTFQALLRRSCGDESSSGFPPVLWAENVSQKVKVLRLGVADARLMFRGSPIRAITFCVHMRASTACPRRRITKSSA